MQAVNSKTYQYVFWTAPAIPSVILGAALIVSQNLSIISLSFVVLTILASLACGVGLWEWHVRQILNRNLHHKNTESNNLKAYTTEMERLLLMVPPKIFEQTSAAKALTEQEVAELIRQFSTILIGLQQIITLADQATSQDVLDYAEKIRTQVDAVLQSLQFQDRVSQILTQVEDNLSNLRDTVEKIQSQGSARRGDMIKVEETLSAIKKNYEAVNHLPVRSAEPEDEADGLTFF